MIGLQTVLIGLSFISKVTTDDLNSLNSFDIESRLVLLVRVRKCPQSLLTFCQGMSGHRDNVGKAHFVDIRGICGHFVDICGHI
jgi:hypothetical protein